MIKVGDIVEFECVGKKIIGIVYQHEQLHCPHHGDCSLVFIEESMLLHRIEDWRLTWKGNVFDLIREKQLSFAERLLPKSWRNKYFPKFLR